MKKTFAIALAVSPCLVMNACTSSKALTRPMQPLMQQGKYQDAYCAGMEAYTCMRFRMARVFGFYRTDYVKYLNDMYICSFNLDSTSGKTLEFKTKLDIEGAKLPGFVMREPQPRVAPAAPQADGLPAAAKPKQAAKPKAKPKAKAKQAGKPKAKRTGKPQPRTSRGNKPAKPAAAPAAPTSKHIFIPDLD